MKAKDTESSSNVFKIAETLTVKPIRAVVTATVRNRGGVAGFVVIIAVVFSAGWFGHAAASRGSHGPFVKVQDTSSRATSIVDGTALGGKVPDVGILDGVSVIGTWTKVPPKSTSQWYMVSIEFPQSDADCGNSCSEALRDVLGSDSCFDHKCIAELKDVDEGSKTNSTDIYAQCLNYHNENQKVLIEFSGRRDQAASQYANILLVVPSSS